MKVLVVGGTGFVGSYLVALLKDSGYDFLTASLDPRADIVADFTKQSEFAKLPTDVWAICNLMAYIPNGGLTAKLNPEEIMKCMNVNVLALSNLLQFANNNGISMFIQSSSLSVYGQNLSSQIDERCEPAPQSGYALSKLLGERLCEVYPGNCVVLRYSSIYGANQRAGSVVPVFIEKAIKGEGLKVYGEGKRTMDFVYVKDVALANLCALHSNTSGIYNIGSGVGTSMLQLADDIKNIFGDHNLQVVKDNTKTEEDISISMNIGKARRELQYYPSFSLVQGLEDYKYELS